ncbi:hypothetical protein F5Y05DRAFT_49891 [Hypoxylon sp. FL0543]|nr:hypothetical protein F5Y05DRAFT_49891 [Hypoxylon sp. FL0543]
MLVHKLRPWAPQLMRCLCNRKHGGFRAAYQSPARPTLHQRPFFKPGTCAMSSSKAASPEKKAAADAPSVEKTAAADAPSVEKTAAVDAPAVEKKTGDSDATPATAGDDGAAEAASKKRVAILWDLDNKPPRALPVDVATSIRALAERRGEIVEYSAMANYHAFVGLPLAAMELKRDRKMRKMTEGYAEGQFICPVCGNKFKTEAKMTKHYEQLHERERKKKLNRLGQLKGKKRKKWLEKNVGKLEKYSRAHTAIYEPEKDHKVYRSLKRCGVRVRIVTKAPQAADEALAKRFAKVRKDPDLTLILISDDSDFYNMVQRARAKYGVRIVVMSRSQEGKLAKIADEWVSWDAVNDVARSYKNPPLPPGAAGEDEGLSKLSEYEVDDDVVDEIMARQLGMYDVGGDEDEMIDVNFWKW